MRTSYTYSLVSFSLPFSRKGNQNEENYYLNPLPDEDVLTLITGDWLGRTYSSLKTAWGTMMAQENYN